MHKSIWPLGIYGIAWLFAFYVYAIQMGQGPLVPVLWLLVKGVAVCVIAVAFTRRAQPFSSSMQFKSREFAGVVFLILALIVLSYFSSDLVSLIRQQFWPGSRLAYEVLSTGLLIIVWGALPYGLARLWFGHSNETLGWQTPAKRMFSMRHLGLGVVVGFIILAWAVAQQLGHNEIRWQSETRMSELPLWQSLFAIFVALFWSFVVIGPAMAVGQYGVLFNRFAALFRNDWAALTFVVLFGAVLTTVRLYEWLGQWDEVFRLLALDFLSNSPQSLALGFVWLRTRNLALLAFLSGMWFVPYTLDLVLKMLALL